MTQPENDQTATIQENKLVFGADQSWVIEFDHLRTDVISPTATEDNPVVNVGQVRWYRYESDVPFETEAEKQEKHKAIGEQIQQGILMVAPDGRSVVINDNKIKRNNIKTMNITQQPLRLTKPQKIGPNEQCPCGSGRKFKKCCQHKKYIR
jgi:hypothetical protein